MCQKLAEKVNDMKEEKGDFSREMENCRKESSGNAVIENQ